MSDNVSSLPRARQACDPCRRKKTKCPGERPACSFCTRLNQRCSYGRTEEVLRVQRDHRHDRRAEKDDSRDRVQRLEARVDQIMNILVERQTEHSPLSRAQQFSSTSIGSPDDRVSSQAVEDPSVPEGGWKFDAKERPIPPASVLRSLVDVYRERIHCQPLPLFDLESLPSLVGRFPDVLLRSFLALTARYLDHEFFDDSKSAAVDLYMQSAREMSFAQLAEPTGSIELLQSLCLLSLCDIAECKRIRAWTTIGVAVRLAISTNVLMCNPGRSSCKKSEAHSRCCWSLFVLDKIHCSSFQTLPAIPDDGILPEKPLAPLTPNVASAPEPGEQRMLQVTEEKDDGVTSYCLQLLSTWGRLMAYLKSIRQGHLEDAWTPNSTYQQIKSLMFRFETVLPEVHRFHNARFHERTPSQAAAEREYWTAWILMQMMFHTIHCTLNHPFLHLAEIHRRQRLRSPSFLQHATDQAILHSAWIIRILDLCTDHGFAVYDPFVGHLASMIATVLFFLRFSRDGTLAAKAAKDFEVCQRFVDRMAEDHSHLQYTKLKLAKLAQSTTQVVQPPKVETALLWDLLDYAASAAPSESNGVSSGDVELNINTQFLSPPQDNTPRPVEVSIPQEQQLGPDNSMSDPWEDSSFNFDMVDFSTLPDVSTLTMPKEFWTNGHL